MRGERREEEEKGERKEESEDRREKREEERTEMRGEKSIENQRYKQTVFKSVDDPFFDVVSWGGCFGKEAIGNFTLWLQVVFCDRSHSSLFRFFSF